MSASPFYTLTQTAEQDLLEMQNWSLARWGQDKTIKYLIQLHEALEKIGKNPAAYRSRDELTAGSRLSVYPAKQHYVVYLPKGENHIIVVALIRQGRDVPAILSRHNFQISEVLKEIEE